MAWKYLLSPTIQVVNTAGKPATGGHIEVYVHGTGDKYYCASDFDGTLLPFKIPLDSLGASIVLADDSQTYDVYVYNRYGGQMMSRYNVAPMGTGSEAYSGDVSDATVTFSEAETRANISSGEKLSVICGKIKKWFSDLKALAFKDKADLTQDVSGILPIAKGGTGGTSAAEALTNLSVYSKSETDLLLNDKIPTSQKGAANGVGTLDSNGVQPYSEVYKGCYVNSEGTRKLCRIPNNYNLYSGGVSFLFTVRTYNGNNGQIVLWVSPVGYGGVSVDYKVVNLFSRQNDVSMSFYYDEVLVDGTAFVDVYYEIKYEGNAFVVPLSVPSGIQEMLNTATVTIPGTAVEMTPRYMNVFAEKGGVGSALNPVYIDEDGNAAACTPQVFMATYGDTTYSEIENAYFNNESIVFCKNGNYLYPLKGRYGGNKFIFESTVDKDYGEFETITLTNSNVWSIETHSVDEYCVYRKSYDNLHPLSASATATDISNGYIDVEFDLGNADGFEIGDGNTLVFIGIPNKGGPGGTNFADAFTKVELYAISENNTPYLAAKVKDTSKDDYGDTLATSDLYMWNRTYSGNRTSLHTVKKFKGRFYLNMNTAWVPDLATSFYIYFTILL